MTMIELLAQTVNILNDFLADNEMSIIDDDRQQWLDMAEAKLEQEGYSMIPFTSRWSKDK